MKHYVYILYSESLDRFYVGHTDGHISGRLKKHLSHIENILKGVIS